MLLTPFISAQNMVQTTSKIKSVIDIDHMSNETRARFLMELKGTLPWSRHG